MNLSCSQPKHEKSASNLLTNKTTVSEPSNFLTPESYLNYLKTNAVNQLNSDKSHNSTLSKTLKGNSDESSSSFVLMNQTNGHDRLQSSRQTLPQCATSMAGLPRFPTPTNVEDSRVQLNLSAPRLVNMCLIICDTNYCLS